MKQFHSKLDKLYEGLHLKKTYTEESKRPNFKIEDFILASVYDHIDKNILGFDWDFSDKEIVSDLMGQFKQIKNMIETRYETMNKETKTAPDGHYYTKSGNLVKGRLSADAEERGARKSDPKDKQRSKTPPVSQYNEERPMATLTPPGIPQRDIGGEGTFITSGDTLIVSIDDVEDRIDGLEFKNLSTGETQTSMIRIRARLETLLRKMGYDVEAPNQQGEYEVRIYWKDKTGDEIDRFKLVRKSRM